MNQYQIFDQQNLFYLEIDMPEKKKFVSTSLIHGFIYIEDLY